MTATEKGIIDEIRTSLRQGATLRDVDSTDDQLVLVFRGEQEDSRFRLDAAATRHLIEAGILDRLTGSAKAARKMTV